MKFLRTLLFLYIARSILAIEVSHAADEGTFLEPILPSSEQVMRQNQSVLWTLPHVATQYQPLHPTPAMQSALQAQYAGRFLDALILLDDAGKNGQVDEDAAAEMSLLRASFLLQGDQSRQAMDVLAPLLAKQQYAADAYALTAMAYLQQGQMQKALEAAQRAQGPGAGMLPNLALSYALQGIGHLTEARDAVHGFNAVTPSAISLAREAELALTLDQVRSARVLAFQAREMEPAHPYVIAVNGLAYLIDGHVREAKAAFESALQHDPKDAKALLGLGLAEIKLGDLQDGQKKLQAANEADPDNPLILTYLGRAQQQTGQTEAAMASWRSAQLADPKDPTPWLYQAQAQLQANHPMEARESLREAQARTSYRAVYRGEHLLREDEQLLQANLAEIQRRLGLEGLAFHILTDSASEKNSANLGDQADILRGRRFAESARRSLLLQSQFSDRPGDLPAALDVYGDGAGQTGASTPQHGVVSGLNPQQASYNNYDELFSQHTALQADAVSGSRDTNGEQVRFGVGNDTLGLGVAQLKFRTDGYAPFERLDNGVWQSIAQWRPFQSTQAFVSYQTFNSQRGETFYPADPLFGTNATIEDGSYVTRLGVRHALVDDSELRGLWSLQHTNQAINYQDFSVPPITFSQYGRSDAYSAELQYRRSGATHVTQWGAQQTHGQTTYWDAFGNVSGNNTQNAQQFYAAWQQMLNSYWQLDMELGWGSIDNQDDIGSNSTYLQHWLPKFGVVYTPDAETHLRFAAWQGLGIPGVGDAALAPVSLAGVLLSRPSDNSKLVRATAVGADRQLSSAWLLAADTQQRKADQPAIVGQQIFLIQQVDESSLALYWQPKENPWAVSMSYDDEHIQNDPEFIPLDSVNEQDLHSQQLAVRWFASARWTANWTWSHNQVAGTQQSHDPLFFTPILLPYQNDFDQVDADLSWQFDGARGLLTTGVRNATDAHFQYVDIDKLNPRFSNGRLLYVKLKFAW